jgi:hypothetical protein
MRIHFVRSGGYAAIRLETTVVSEQLPDNDAQALQDEIEVAGFYQLPTKMAAPGKSVDRFHYRITVESENRRHTVELDDSQVPDALWPLIRRLTSMAMSPRK